MSLFASLGAATLEYSTRERRAALRRPLNLWDSHSLSGSSEGCLSPQHRGQSSSDRASSEDGDEVPSSPGEPRSSVGDVLGLLASLEPLLALTHALALERGTTTGWVASCGTKLAQAAATRRAVTDAALAAAPGDHANLAALLSRCRTSADRDVAAASKGSTSAAEEGAAFVATMGGYNALAYQALAVLSELPACAAATAVSEFAALKETFAQIRGYVTGALLLRDAALAAVHGQVKGSLVIAFHRRRAYARSIRHQTPRRLLRLIGAGLELPAGLAQVVQRLEVECDLVALRATLKPQQWWGLVTAHIDSLETMQHLLLGACARTAQRRAAAVALGAGAPAAPLSAGPRAASPRRRPSLRQLSDDEPSAGSVGSVGSTCSAGSGPASPPRGGHLPRAADSYTRLFGSPGYTDPPALHRRPSDPLCRPAGGRPAGGASAAPATLLQAAALLTLGRAAVRHGADGANELASRLSQLPARRLKESLLALVDERMARHSASPSPNASPVVTRLHGAAGAENTPPASPPASPRKSPPKPALPEAALLQPPDGARLIGLSEILFAHRIGEGGAGATYLAQWNGATVAVKVAGGVCKWLESWRAEVAALTELRHPNVVEFLGCVVEPPTHCLVLQFCEGGDLYEALRRPTPPGLALKVGRGVAAGMLYLHKKNYIHRDLKSSNVLLDASGTAKLMDFGLSRQLDVDAEEQLTAETGTYRWMAPEVIRHEPYSASADVFSYAMLWFELITHEVPYADRPPLQAAVCTGLQGLRPPLPAATPPSVRSLIERCWAAPEARPSFAELVALTGDLEPALSQEERAWLDAPAGHAVSYDEMAPPRPENQPGERPAAACGDAGAASEGPPPPADLAVAVALADGARARRSSGSQIWSVPVCEPP